MSKILLVEDDNDLVNIYKEELSFSNIDFDIATNGEDAIKKNESFDYDLIMLDIMLPDISGIDVLKKIKEKDKDKKVIVISNLEVPAIINQAFALGVNAYLIKAELLPSQIIEEVKRLIT
jgi:DNA-binding response OmpR family regulator